MKVYILDKKRKKNVSAEIEKANKIDLANLKKSWLFDWNSLYSKNSLIYKLSYSDEIQGFLNMLLVDEGYYEMKNLELAKSNLGRNGNFQNVAGCLIAYACLLSFELNKGNYQGFLSFTSKGELIEHYQKNYFAELVYREKMIIFPKYGKILIKKYLNIGI